MQKKSLVIHKNHTIRRMLAFCLALCLMMSLLSGCKNPFVKSEAETLPATEITEPEEKELSATDLLKAVVSLKDDVKTISSDIKHNKFDDAKTKIASVQETAGAINVSLEKTIANMNGSVPALQEQLENIQAMLEMVDVAVEKLVYPALDQLQTYPISGMRSGDGINTKYLGHYLDFAESVMPDVEALMESAGSVDLSLIDSDGKLSGYLDTANKLLEVYRTDKTIFSKVRSILGIDEDRLYLVAAQNSAEIRASGGFPGSVGTIRIKDGILTVGNFESVYDVLSNSPQPKAQITPTEYKLFGYFNGMQTPRDADLCPDFQRVAYIWSLGYSATQKETVDGVISMTPSIIQRLLAVTGEEIELFDGLVLTEDNATKVLQHDLYFKYYTKTRISKSSETTDMLFADAAQKAMDMLMDNLSVSDLLGYLSVAMESFGDRTLLLWMQDEAEQATIAQLGWNGGLNTDPEKPQAGVYFNCTIASKMGWFLLMDTEMGERTKNADGSYTYPITVTFSNDITKEEIDIASNVLILGGQNGSVRGAAYFFAPAGGTIGDFTVSSGDKIKTETYQDLELGYLSLLLIKPNDTVTVTYNITTAPGVETPLVFSTTPTVQAYH